MTYFILTLTLSGVLESRPRPRPLGKLSSSVCRVSRAYENRPKVLLYLEGTRLDLDRRRACQTRLNLHVKSSLKASRTRTGKTWLVWATCGRRLVFESLSLLCQEDGNTDERHHCWTGSRGPRE